MPQPDDLSAGLLAQSDSFASAEGLNTMASPRPAASVEGGEAELTLVVDAASAQAFHAHAELQGPRPHTAMVASLLAPSVIERLESQESPLTNVDERDRARMERDSPCIVTPEQRFVGKLLSNASRKPSKVCRALQVVCVLLAADAGIEFAGRNADMAGMAKANPLLYVSGLLGGASALLIIPVISSAQRVLCPGGQLEQLGAGTALISADYAQKQRRLQMAVRVFELILIPLGLLTALRGVLEVHSNGSIKEFGSILAGLLFTAAFPVGCAGWSSMYTGSCLCRESIVEVVHDVLHADPTTNEWRSTVAVRALQIRHSLQLLSEGWGIGLASTCGGLWLLALSFFTLAINHQYVSGCDAHDCFLEHMPDGFFRWFYFSMVFLFTVIPLLLTVDVSNTSTFCNLFLDQLNTSRIKHGPESQANITWLETALTKLVRAFFATALCDECLGY
jgi:hypothetical protein